VIDHIGPRARRVDDTLRARVVGGELAVGAQLPSCVALAAQLGVAPLTRREVVAQLRCGAWIVTRPLERPASGQLEQPRQRSVVREGLVSPEPARGTSVQAPAAPAVLTVDEADMRQRFSRSGEQGGVRALAVADPREALDLLEAERRIALVLGDARMPTAAQRLALIRTARRRWPERPLAAVTDDPADLDELRGRRGGPSWC
jgi:CheY-like chemotaxis protein